MGLRELTLTAFSHIPWNAPFYARHGFELAGHASRRPHLEQALQREAALGLQGRVAMIRRMATPSAPTCR